MIEGTLLALLAMGLATKTAGGGWIQSLTQVIHQSAAMAGIIFLGVTLHRFLIIRYTASAPFYICILLSLAALFSWWLRAGIHPHLRNRRTKNTS
jgi:hypothetical protein